VTGVGSVETRRSGVAVNSNEEYSNLVNKQTLSLTAVKLLQVSAF